MDHYTIDAPFLPISSGVPRSTDTLHLTTVIKTIEDEMGWGYKGKGFQDMGLTMSVGFLWEEALSNAFGTRLGARVGEVELDGIVGSPDGIGFDDPIFTCDMWPNIDEHNVVLEEYKCSWKSIKKEAQLDWYWMTQIMAYCRMLDLDTCIMKIIHLNGDYKGSGPLYRMTRLVYSDWELETNWKMITTMAEKIKEERKNG